jgi:formylglycine-generating enzyme required for sulfatase activity
LKKIFLLIHITFLLACGVTSCSSGTNELAGPGFVNSAGMKMIEVTSGSVTGSAWRFGKAGYEMGPAREIVIAENFYMGATEVTQEQWEKVTGSNPSFHKGKSLPVDQVTWDDALAFCERLTSQDRESGKLPEGFVYALPTSLQWEYVCRAGSTGDYGGTGRLDEMGWHGDIADGQTHPVAGKKPNAWGFYDMHGNVWEWALDKDPQNENQRLTHGGGWVNTAADARSGAAVMTPADAKAKTIGLRLAAVRKTSP